MTPWKLNDKDLIHWTKDNQRDSIIKYLKYRPLFWLRYKYYKALYCTYLKDNLNNIFSINDYNVTHKILKIFGIKIKFPKSGFNKKKKENPYYYYKKNNIDITSIPPATGQIRDIQLASFALLKELDYVCKQNNLHYWLDYGTLMGAVRHKGFIPWDDDIDVSMLRKDYNKVIKAFEKSSRNKDIYARYEIAETSAYRLAIKVRHRRCPHLFVDIFPDDLYGRHLSRENQLKVTDELKSQWKDLQKELTHDTPFDIAQNKFLQIINRNISDTRNQSESDILMGMDFYHSMKYWLYDNDIFFPLKDIEFEGCKFPAVNQPEKYLEMLYGNYMSYPDKIGFGHNSYVHLSDEDEEIISDLLKEIINVSS